MSIGFFRGDKSVSSPIRTSGCSSCGLAFSGCLHPKMQPTGEGRKGILFVAEAPGETEDKKGTQLIGKVGQFLRETLREMNIDLDADCRKTNSVICRPPSNRTPEKNEIDACRPFLMEEIRKFKPRVIIALGGPALRSLIRERWKHDNDLTINRWRGLTIPDQDLEAWICPTFHPSYVKREENSTEGGAVRAIWKRDLHRAISLCKSDFPKPLKTEVRFLKEDEVGPYLLQVWKKGQRGGSLEPPKYTLIQPGTKAWMSYWKTHPEHQEGMLEFTKTGRVSLQGKYIISFDYEADGLKPYHPNHKIWYCSIAESPEHAVSWRWMDSERAMFRQVMECDKILKVGANIKFETVWTSVKLGHGIKSWLWDVMNAGHIQDNRRGNSNMAFLTYTKLGLLGFKDDTDSYLKAENSNAFNRIHLIPPEKIMRRNALDSAYEFAISQIQMREYGFPQL